MRHLAILAVFASTLTGCLFGTSGGQTTSEYAVTDGRGHVQRASYTVKSSGHYLGGNVPLMMPAGGMGMGLYGMAGTNAMYGQSYGSTICNIHPDYCAQGQTVEVYTQQVPVIVHERPVQVSGGGDASAAPAADDGRIEAMLAKHEKALRALSGQYKQTARQLCQVIVAKPESITDEAERADLVSSCKQLLKSHPYANPDALAPAKEEN